MTKKKLKKLILNLECVTSIHVPAKYVHYYTVEGITRTASMHIDNDKRCEDRLVSEYFCCEISHWGNGKEAWRPKDIADIEPLPFDRIEKCPDICSVTLVYKDDTREEVWVNWWGTDEVNHLQKSFMNGKALRIEIGKQKVRYK